jgi:hemerythrin-like domain-containing protein
LAIFRRHDTYEREVLYPLVRARLRNGENLAREAEVEHADALLALEELARGESAHSPTMNRQLVAVGNDIRRHIRHEDRRMIRRLRRTLTLEERYKLTDAIEGALGSEPTDSAESSTSVHGRTSVVGRIWRSIRSMNKLRR